ncbi:MAG: hypothetical protein HYX27_20770 [Acidobacteria bacterium]|nr:hypothetical protein [Acidobacteriota bacterium]
MLPVSTRQNASPLISGLFVASAMLAVVSWYTTFEGMSLYLSKWFALLASLGVQMALLFVAWLIGFSRTRRVPLYVVYGITAVVSVAFSYVSLYRWFSERERPAQVRRQLYDRLSDSAAKADAVLASASAESRKHTLALEEMTQAEKLHGHISRAADADPYLNRIRESVAREAQGVGDAYREGSGAGVRYTAFERHARLARESQQSIDTARASIANWRTSTKPDEAAEKQLRSFHTAFDAVPWSEVNDALHSGRQEKPDIPPLAEFVDQTSGGQEDLILAFSELIAAPTPRHAFAFVLAAFIDVIIFLLAYASGPYMAGSPEQRMTTAAASLESLDRQVFTRDLLRKVSAAPGGLARINRANLSPGEEQFLLTLTASGHATQIDDTDGSYWLLDAETHAAMLESLAERGLPLRASRAATA